MITWIQVWPILGIPTLVVAGTAGLPTAAFNGRILGGGPVREWLLNHLMLPLLPSETGYALMGWFQQASGIQEWLIALLIALNVNALALPAFYGLGFVIIATGNWFTNKNLELKRSAAR